MRRSSRLARIAIGLFFCWHVIAIGLYAIPTETQDAAARFARFTLSKPFGPYLRLTSQWQQWNLFSPNPLRRVPRYVVEMQEGTRWKQAHLLDLYEIPLWSHSTVVKGLLGILESDMSTYNLPLVEHFTKSFCHTLKIPSGSTLRITTLSYVIEVHSLFASLRPISPSPQISSFHSPAVTCP